MQPEVATKVQDRGRLARSLRTALLSRTALCVMLAGVVVLVPGRASNIVVGLGGGAVAEVVSAFADRLPVRMGAWLQDRKAPESVVATANLVSVPVLAAPAPAASSGAPRQAPVAEEAGPADGRLLAEVARRQAELDRRSRDLDARAARIRAAEQLAREQIAELARVRAEIEALVVRETEVADADMEAAVGLYGNMRPQDAAKVFDKMSPQRAAAILRRLGDRLAGPVLARMEPEAALAVTDEIVGRREAFRREAR